MNENTKKETWPILFGVLCIIYVLIYAAAYVMPSGSNNSPQVFNIGICLLFLAGGIGMFKRRKWAVSPLLLGSLLVVIQVIIVLAGVARSMGGALPPFVILGLLTAMLPTLLWPLYLLIWFSRRHIRERINNEWA